MTPGTSLPPGPRIPRLIQSAMFAFWPLEAVLWMRRRHGDVFRLNTIPFRDPIVYVADPKLIGEVFKADPAVFRAGEAHEVLGIAAGRHSLLVIDEPEHMPMRKLMLPPFHGEAVKRYRELMERIAAQEVARWPVGEPFALQPRMQAITLEVILRAVFGISEAERLDALRQGIPEFLDTNPLVAMWEPVQRYRGPRSPWKRFERRRDAIDAILYDEIARRRADPDGGEPGSVMSLLVKARDEDGNGLSDEVLRDELMTLLLAGHETTATALAWAFERLLRTPGAMERLVAKLDAGGDGADEYLDAVAKETLRVRPVIIDVGRRLAKPAEIAGRMVPAGTIVMPAIALAHLDERSYPAALEFRPERFLEGQPEPYTWIPFGGGVRRCIGASFAQVEMKAVLAEVVRRTRLRPASAKPERAVFKHVTVVPRKGCQVVLEGRVEPPHRGDADEREPALSAG
jgi:cytochrome P450